MDPVDTIVAIDFLKLQNFVPGMIEPSWIKNKLGGSCRGGQVRMKKLRCMYRSCE
jgi:hypothetical protein